MTNELKPCPFCGGKAELYHEDTNCDYVRNNHYPVVSCPDCGCRTIDDISLTDDNLAIQDWNTRQPAFDWKPIEELNGEHLTGISDLVIYNRNSGIYVIPNIWVIKGVVLISEYDYENKRPIEDIQSKYTHYTLLTPPQTNQS